MRQRRLSDALEVVGPLVASGLAVLALGAGSAAAGTLSSLPKGAEIDVRSCTYGPDETHAGRYSGQYLVDRNAYYAIVFVPTDLPGGHFRFRGVYPRARWFSFESYTRRSRARASWTTPKSNLTRLGQPVQARSEVLGKTSTTRSTCV